MIRYLALFAAGLAVGIYVAAPWLPPTETDFNQPTENSNYGHSR